MSEAADSPRATEAPGRDAPHGDPRAAAILVAFVMFLSILEATVIATALPDMARDFGVAASELASASLPI
ncbi:multidrug efflux MFS transporter [Novosphingobium sp. BW1]|uniref:multidrug efflux MFS transporter n=1 Tax=Novosphingobium sp. BW1 TaxID=2592621 RepID=UPI0011DECB18|nr:multidrug efflux MFS transporter [Novosphingobium sp. BW1]TYC84941.1 multidrug efflux MFS transporter [Novosphingobium sp. BW1]